MYFNQFCKNSHQTMPLSFAKTKAGYQKPANEYDRFLIESINNKKKQIAQISCNHNHKKQVIFLEKLLDLGKFFGSQPLPKPYIAGEDQACFQNAQQLALTENELTYVEGFGLRILPFYHAWCIDPNGLVIDNTWQRQKKKQSLGTAYFGIPLSQQAILRSISETKYYQEVITTELLASSNQ